MVDAALISRAFDRKQLVQVADWLAVAVAVSLPWSTSATGILLVLWLIALLPTLELATVRRALTAPAGYLPAALWLLAAVGMLWATDIAWATRVSGLGVFHKLLLIPMFLAAFSRSDAGMRVAVGFLVSCVALLVLSIAFVMWPGLQWRWMQAPGVPVKDYIAQSGEFVLCAFALFHLALNKWQADRRLIALALVALAFLFLADVVYVATGRTALVVIPVLAALFGLQRFGPKGAAVILVAGAVLAAVVWASSPYLRNRVLAIAGEITLYEEGVAETSTGQRFAFWKKSIGFIAEAPLIGHGTGSTKELFSRAVVGKTGADAIISSNPHNQTLAVAIQLGIVGAALLWAMWIAHVLLFRGSTLPAWLGMTVATQTIVASLFNSHLNDFTQGWTYVVGVGVLGGMMLRATRSSTTSAGT